MQLLQVFVIMFLAGMLITVMLQKFYSAQDVGLLIIVTIIATVIAAKMEFKGHISDDQMVLPIGVLIGELFVSVVNRKSVYKR